MQVLGSTLILTWIPNSTLRKNPRSIENSPRHPGVPLRVSPRRSPRQEFARPDFLSPVSKTSNHDQNEDVQDSGKEGGNTSEKDGSVERDNEPLSGRIVYDERTDSIYGPVDGVAEGESVGVDKKREGKTESGSPVTERQLSMILHKKRIQEIKKERNSSSRSITSIEMDGDQLVVTTEMEEDSIFEDEASESCNGKGSSSELQQYVSRSHKDSGIGTLTSHDTECTSSSSSEYPSPTSEHYHRILGELQQQSGSGTPHQTATEYAQLTEAALESHTKAQMEKLKESLSLQLDPTTNDPIMAHTPDISVSPGSCSSGSTSGPDSRPPTPVTPPDSPPHQAVSPEIRSPAISESGNEIQNMTFPHSSVSYENQQQNTTSQKKSAKEQICGVFSVDLGKFDMLVDVLSNNVHKIF